MQKILMVCLGNICRSPMAEGIMRSKIEKYKLQAEVDSCGTAAYHVGEQPDRRAMAKLQEHGMDISDLSGRQFEQNDFDRFDMIYVMDSQNYRNVLRLVRNENDRQKVSMIMNEVYPNGQIDVADPYFGGAGGFNDTYQMLDKATEKIAKKILKTND